MAKISLAALPAMQAQRLGPDRWALRHGDDVLSWGELDRRSTQRAWAMKAHGVTPSDLVTLSLTNSNAFYEWLFAIWKAGATPHVVSWRLPKHELSAILELARPKLLIASNPEFESAFAAKPVTFGLDERLNDPLPEAISNPWKAMSSGGSTGRPKIILAPQPNLFDPEEPRLRLPQDGVILNPGPLYHNAPVYLTVMGMLRGSSIVGMTKFEPEEALRLISLYRVNWVNFVPTMMNRISRLPQAIRERYDVSSLETVWHMAAPMPAALKEEWIAWLGPDRIWEFYGSTESIGSTTISGTDWLAHRGSVGLPNNCRIKVLDEAGDELPPGEIGEIFFLPNTGPGSTYRYLGAQTKPAAGGYESVGDFGWKDEDGFLYIADRRTDMIVSGGANIFPAEIENALMEHPGVEAAVVIGLPDEEMGALAHAIVKPSPNFPALDEAQLKDHVRERLALYKNPRSYEFVTEDLRDDAGKVRRAAMRAARLAQM